MHIDKTLRNTRRYLPRLAKTFLVCIDRVRYFKYLYIILKFQNTKAYAFYDHDFLDLNTEN